MSAKKTALILAAITFSLVAARVCSRNRDWLWYRCTGTVTIDGLIFHLNPEDEVITAQMVERRSWEPAETALIRNRLWPGDTFIDVGANIGYYTVVASKLVGPTGRVIAFEPDPTNFALLKRNVEANRCDNVILEQKALSDESGTVKLFLADKNKGDHRIFDFGERRPFVEVEAVSLDDYLGDDQRSIDHIKIDTQGAEGVIVEGMRESLCRHRNVTLFMEFWPYGLDGAGYDSAELLAILESHGFELREIDRAKGQLVAVTAAQLLARYTPENRGFADLVLQRSQAASTRRASLGSKPGASERR